MSEQTFCLFRITIHHKIDLFIKPNYSKEELLTKIFKLKQEESNQSSHDSWKIVTVEQLSDSAYYFRFGRNSHRTFDILHNGEPKEACIDLWPNSHCFIDTKLQLLVMSVNKKLSASVKGQGKFFERFINNDLDHNLEIDTIEIRPIPDPKEFAEKIAKAYSISRFWIKIRKPNPFDITNHIIKPMSELNNEMDSNEIKLEIIGHDLPKNNIEALTKDTALAGSEGGVYLKQNFEGRTKYFKLGDKHLSFVAIIGNDKSQKKNILDKCINLFNQLKANSN